MNRLRRQAPTGRPASSFPTSVPGHVRARRERLEVAGPEGHLDAWTAPRAGHLDAWMVLRQRHHAPVVTGACARRRDRSSYCGWCMCAGDRDSGHSVSLVRVCNSRPIISCAGSHFPSLLRLTILTFILVLPPIPGLAGSSSQRGVEWSIVARAMATLLPAGTEPDDSNGGNARHPCWFRRVVG